MGLQLLLGGAAAALLPGQLLGNICNSGISVLDVRAQQSGGALLVPGLSGKPLRLLPHPLLRGVVLLHPQGEAVVFLIERVLPLPGGLLPLPGGGVLRLEAVLRCLDFLQPLQPDGNLQDAQLVAQQQKPPGCLRLGPQGRDLELQLADFIIDAHQVLLRALETTLRLLLAVAVLGDPCRLLEDLPPVRTAGGQDLVDAALADDGVSLPAQTRVHKQLVDIPQPHGLLINIVFALPAAVVAAGDHHLAAVNGGEDPLAVVQHQRHLGKAHGAALLRAAEDDILHFTAAEAADGLLPHHPADGIGYIGLPGPVGPHNGGNILAKI